MKLLYYESYLADLEEKHEFARNYAIFNGSFFNMEMAQRIISEENPDYESTEDDFAESTKMVLDSRENTLSEQKRKRKRRKVLNQK